MHPTTNHVYRGVDGSVKKTEAPLPDLKDNEILLRITHSGLCYTDVLFVGFGIALGHEGVGIVEAIGSSVTQFNIGDRAGAGFHRSSCGHCKYCLSGNDIWCYERNIPGEADFNVGTFGDYYIGKETYLHKIPDALSSEAAAPLQCAGATVYSALISSGAKTGQRVGVFGIGGLGHLAIQFAAKMGFEVVAFSTSTDKEAEAKGYGASEFYQVNEPEKLKAPIDVLIVAGAQGPDYTKYFDKSVIARGGTIVNLTAPHGPGTELTIPAFEAFFNGYNVRHSLVASRADHENMLEFAAYHQIQPKVELFDMTEQGLGDAIARLSGKEVDGKKGIRYRGVGVAKDQ